MAEESQSKPETGGKGEAAPAATEEKKADTAEPAKKPDFDPEAFKADITKQFKAEITGLNRRNSELEKKLEEAEKAKMTEKERAEFDLKQAREAADKARREAQEFQLERTRLEKLFAAGLDADAAPLVGGNTPEEIEERVKKLNEYIDKRASARVEAEVKKRFDGTGKPGGGDKPGATLTYEDVLKLSEAEIKKLPPEMLDQFFKK
jgi:DNA repair exonuclease SbcCD ATPase subunit